MATELAAGFLTRDQSRSLPSVSIYAPLPAPPPPAAGDGSFGGRTAGPLGGPATVPVPALEAAGQIFFKEAMETWPGGFDRVPVYRLEQSADPQTALPYLYALLQTLAGSMLKSNEWLWVYVSLYWGRALLHGGDSGKQDTGNPNDDATIETAVTALLKHLGKPENEPNRHDFQTVARLDGRPLLLLTEYALPVMAIVRFSRFSEEEQKLFVHLLADHTWKRNILGEFIENIYDLDNRSQVLHELIELSENLTQKQARFRQTWLREKIVEYRYPRWASKMKDVRTALATVPKTKGISVRTGDGLEDNFLTAEIQIRNSADLDRLLSSLDSSNWQKAVKNALDKL